MKIQCLIEKTPLGTGGSLFKIKKKLDDVFWYVMEIRL